MVNLMFGPAAPLEVFPRCAMMRKQKAPTPPAVLSASARTWLPLENLYFTVSWSRKSLVSLPPFEHKSVAAGDLYAEDDVVVGLLPQLRRLDHHRCRRQGTLQLELASRHLPAIS